jgi:outer membrane protein TolC
LQGLVIDERRAGRKMAEIGMNIADEGLNVNNNNLVYQSVLHYLGWTQSYKSVILFRQAVGNVNQRLQAVRNQVLSGDRPGIDTVEVNIQKQLLEISLQEAEAALVQSRTMLNTFIWNEGLQNAGLSPNDIPEDKIDTVGNVTSDITLETLVQNHPELRQYNLKLDQMDVERRLKADKLKPNVVLSYNPLFEPVSESLVNNVTFENFKFGVSLYMPLYLRKERGDIRLINSKMNEVKMINLDKTTNIMAKYQAYVVEYNNVRSQLQILEETVILYRQMYEAEIQLFDIGESSLFLVNTREQNLIQSEIKRLELEIKMYKAYFGIFYVSGALPDFFN